MSDDLWRGLRKEARETLEMRDYSRPDLEERVRGVGARAGELAAVDPAARPAWWIPGVEIFTRQVYNQRQRGYFAEFARQGEGRMGAIGFWPRQWATALMHADSAKGFHIHPPHIPTGTDPEAWFAALYGDKPAPAQERPYDLEQWDAMFFLQGTCEMMLVDERAGLPHRRMRFVIEGDNRPGPDNVGIVIPAGVAHGLQSVGNRDLIMVYGTSTTFAPENEGRILSSIEQPTLPGDWTTYFHGR